MSPRHLPQASGRLSGRLALDTALAAGAALRITRFATTDVLGGWVLADPAKRWAEKHEPHDPPHPFGYAAPPSAWRHRLVSALDCPYCVGTQATLAVATLLAALPPRSLPGRATRVACAALAASYAVGHISYRLDSQAPSAQKDTK
jgi:hypothetical protein